MGKKKKPVRLMVMMAIIAVFILGSTKSITLIKNLFGYGELEFKKMTVIDMSGRGNIKVCTWEDKIVIYKQSELKLYNMEGTELWNISLTAQQPLLYSNDNALYLVDKATGEVNCLDGGGKILWTVDAKKPIRYITASQTNTALFTENEEQGGSVLIFDEKGKQKGNIALKKGHIMDLALSKDGGMVAVSVMDVGNNKIESNVILYGINGKLLGGNKYDHEIVTHLFFNKDNELIHIGDKKLMGFGKESGLLWTSNTEGSVSRVKWNEAGFITMSLVHNKKAVIDTKNKNSIAIFDVKGKELGKAIISGDPLGIDAKDDYIVAFTKRTLYYITKEGKELAHKKITNDIEAVHMLSKNTFAVVLGDQLEVIKVKNKQ